MRENTGAHKTRKWTDKEFTEGTDYNYKRYFITYKNFSGRNINNDCKQTRCVSLWFNVTC